MLSFLALTRPFLEQQTDFNCNRKNNNNRSLSFHPNFAQKSFISSLSPTATIQATTQYQQQPSFR